MPQLDPVFQTTPPQLSPSQNLCTPHLSLLQQGSGPSPTTKMDRWMQRWTVTGFQHLQKADSQAPMPGAPPKTEATCGRSSDGETSSLQKAPRTCPGLATALWAPGQGGKTEAAQHVGQVYSHLPHTEPSYPKQNGKEQKQRVSESTAQAGAGPPPGPQREGTLGGWADGHTQPTLWKVS